MVYRLEEGSESVCCFVSVVLYFFVYFYLLLL